MSTPTGVCGSRRRRAALRCSTTAVSKRIRNPELARDVVYSIGGRGRDIWVGRQRGGLTRLRHSNGEWSATTYTKASGLAQDSVYAVHETRDGAVWAGTLSGGASVFRDGRHTTYTTADGLASNTITAIADAPDGSVWFGTPNGVSSLANDRWRTYSTADGLPSNDVAASTWTRMVSSGLAPQVDLRFSSTGRCTCLAAACCRRSPLWA